MSNLLLTLKRCTKCGEAKPLSEFWKTRRTKDGYQHQCRQCRRPGVDAAIARRRARLGDEEFRRIRARTVARSRLLGGADPRPNQARGAAATELIRRHPDEYAALVRLERANLGLIPQSRQRVRSAS